MPEPDVWERFTLDPRHAAHGHMRASDADREVVHGVLGQAYSEGRITSEELMERTDAATQAKTLDVLPALIGDLVASSSPVRPYAHTDLRAEAERRYRGQRRQALTNFLVPSLICWTIWSLTTLGEFAWPIFVTVFTLVPWVRLTTAREDSIESIRRNLERRERRRIAAQEKAQRRMLPPGGWPGNRPGA